MVNHNLMTFVVRLLDHMILVTTMDNAPDMEEHKRNAKKVIEMLNSRSPDKCVFEAGEYNFFYIVKEGVIFLTMADRGFPRKPAFSYLDKLSHSFINEYRDKIQYFSRPYAAVAFDTVMDRIKTEFLNSSTWDKMDTVNRNLNEIQSIMTQNIEQVIMRGDALNRVEDKSSKMLEDSKLFKQNAKYMNWMAMWQTYGPIAVIGILVLFVLWWRFF